MSDDAVAVIIGVSALVFAAAFVLVGVRLDRGRSRGYTIPIAPPPNPKPVQWVVPVERLTANQAVRDAISERFKHHKARLKLLKAPEAEEYTERIIRDLAADVAEALDRNGTSDTEAFLKACDCG